MTQLPFVGPGTYLIFGIVLVPVYGMLMGWSLGRPLDLPRWLLGVGYFFGITAALWGGLYVLTVLIGMIFF